MNLNLKECSVMTPEQKRQALLDCLYFAEILSAQLQFRFDDEFEMMIQCVEEEYGKVK